MSCLFDSLSYYVTNMNGKKLRKIIVDFLQEDPILIDPDVRLSKILETENKNVSSYVKKMELDHVWGGAIEIKAFCEKFGISVYVYVISNNDIIKFVPSNQKFEKKIYQINVERNSFYDMITVFVFFNN